MRRGIHSSPQISVTQVVAVWAQAQVVSQTPSWQGQPAPRAIAEEIARHPECESFLWDLLGDTNQLVVAYALLALELMGSTRLTALPQSLLDNRSSISLQFGSIRNGTDLGSFARQIQKGAKLATADASGRATPER
jgi:hypothetical protein